MNKHESGHAITFHSSVAKAQSFQERHQKLFTEVATFHVNGKQTTNDRNVTLKEFERSPKSVVTNARCLTEGVDIPVIDAVYFCDPKNSKIDIVQAAGRALRRADHRGKKLGYVVVPIFHRNKHDIEDTIEEGVFKNLISVIRALSSHDERLVDEIRKIKIGKGARKPQSNRILIEDTLNLITIEDIGDLSEHLFDQVVSNFRLPWRSFEEARAYVHSLNFKNQQAWKKYCVSGEKPADIPAHPDRIYTGQGWESLGNWIGTGRVADHLKQFKSFEEARNYVNSLNLKDVKHWKEYCKSGQKPTDIPATPNRAYENEGWISWGDWLGTNNTGTHSRKHRLFSLARTFVHKLNLETVKDWHTYIKNSERPHDIPKAPNQVYKDNGWEGWSDWLGNGRTRKWRPFNEARSFVQAKKFKSNPEWLAYCKSGNKPGDIPSAPHLAYKNKG